MELTSKERLMRIFKNQEIDRPSLKLWGVGDQVGWLLHERYRPVAELAAQTTDIFGGVDGYGLDVVGGTGIDRYAESWTEETGDPNWVDCHTILHTPKGDLKKVFRSSTIGDPGYDLEHYIKEAEDIEKILSLPFEAPTGLTREPHDRAVAALGDRGIVNISLSSNASYIVHTLMGSETLAYLSVDAREQLDALCAVYAKRIYDHVKKILETGIKDPIFAWVGPEVYLPPLMSPKDFDDFVYKYDKPLCDLIHEHGGYVWVHSHGKVANFVERFMDMGVDVLNPLEPGPNGDIVMSEVVKQYGTRIGLEGNIEIQDILLSSKEHLRDLIDQCVEQGAKSGRFILCPSAGYMEYARPTKQYIDNLMFYLQYGLEAVERYRK